MIKTTFLSLFILTQFAVFAITGDSTRIEYKTILPEEQHAIVLQASMEIVAANHYNKFKLDDQFSSQAFDNYLKHLDPGKVYFLQSDIKDFEKYRYSIDEMIGIGNVFPAFEMYNVLMKRIKDRINYSLDLIKNDFDFTLTDSFRFDREKSPWCADTAEQNKLWNRKIKYECLVIRSTGKDFKSYSETIRKRYQNYDKQASKTKSEDVFANFMNALTELADPHSNYFSPRYAEDFNQSMSLSLEGIGAQLKVDGEYTTVVMIIKGGPADSSKKLFANDKIIAIGQGRDSEMVNVIDWRIDDVVSLIRGKKGTIVRLEIIPASDPSKTKIIELVRDKIKLEEQACKSSIKDVTVNGKKLKLGVINIPIFYIDFAAMQRGDKNYTSTTRDVKKIIVELKKQKVDGIMIDLRSNGGGSLQEAIELTGVFIKSGPVVQVREASGNVKIEKDMDDEIYYDGPLAVMVNRFSASASEIFAAAIQDYGRGIIVGERTYGKGTVQNVVDLNNMIRIPNKKLGEVKITLAKFYRINGGTTQHNGVTPDILFPGVYDDPKYGEDGSSFALKWDSIAAVKFDRVGAVDRKKKTLIDNHLKRIQGNPEFKYLLEDIDYLKKVDSSDYVTLNEKKFKEESDTSDKLKKKRDEERKALNNGKEDKDAKDLILHETEMVIGDFLK
ncbi:MAG: carboxy terminal-processing peptidase [Bacteroidota bacterium]